MLHSSSSPFLAHSIPPSPYVLRSPRMGDPTAPITFVARGHQLQLTLCDITQKLLATPTKGHSSVPREPDASLSPLILHPSRKSQALARTNSLLDPTLPELERGREFGAAIASCGVSPVARASQSGFSTNSISSHHEGLDAPYSRH